MKNPKGLHMRQVEGSDWQWRVYTDPRRSKDSYIGLIDKWGPGVWNAFCGRYRHQSKHERGHLQAGAFAYPPAWTTLEGA